MNEKINVKINENNEIDHVVEINNDKIDELKDLLNLSFINSNKDIINDLFNDDDVIVINDEIFVDVENDIEFINNILIIGIINYFKGSINLNKSFESILYNRFININDPFIIDKILNVDDDNKRYYYYHRLINQYVNYNMINFIYNLLRYYDIYIDEIYESYKNYDEFDDDVNIKNEFLIENYDIDDIFNYDDDVNDKLNDILNSLIVYYDKYDLYDDINEIFDIKNDLEYYVNYDSIIDDLLIDEYYIEFKNYYIHNSYF